MKQFLSRITDSILLNPIRSCSILFVLLLLSFWQASKLTVNSNNLDLLPKNNPSVVKTQKVIEMIGGNGFYILSIKFKDEKGMTDHLVKAFVARKKGQPEIAEKELKEAEKIKQQNVSYYKERENAIKKASDILNERLLKEKKFVQYISYRYNVSFLQDRLPLFLKTEDLIEVRKRVKRKIDEEVERANPFFIKLSNEEYNPDFNDILSKYQKLAKRDIFDEYNISPDKGMLIFLIKPAGSFTNIEFNIALDKKIKEIVADLGLDKNGIQVGYTGTYRLHLDDYETLMAALKPIAITSFIGIALLLLFFFSKSTFYSHTSHFSSFRNFILFWTHHDRNRSAQFCNQYHRVHFNGSWNRLRNSVFISFPRRIYQRTKYSSFYQRHNLSYWNRIFYLGSDNYFRVCSTCVFRIQRF